MVFVTPSAEIGENEVDNSARGGGTGLLCTRIDICKKPFYKVSNLKETPQNPCLHEALQNGRRLKQTWQTVNAWWFFQNAGTDVPRHSG